jgi:hypothetical protein
MLYVPHSFLVNSHSLSFELPRPADADGTTDGLEPHAPVPHGGLVIACFNTLYKLDRDVFELWASVLRSVRRLPTCALWGTLSATPFVADSCAPSRCNCQVSGSELLLMDPRGTAAAHRLRRVIPRLRAPESRATKRTMGTIPSVPTMGTIKRTMGTRAALPGRLWPLRCPRTPVLAEIR